MPKIWVFNMLSWIFYLLFIISSIIMTQHTYGFEWRHQDLLYQWIILKCLYRWPVEVWIVWGLSWQEGSECKWQQNISFFYTINSSPQSCSRTVGFEEASVAAWLFTTVFYTINSLSEADLMIPSHNCLFPFSLLIFIFEKIFNKNI